MTVSASLRHLRSAARRPLALAALLLLPLLAAGLLPTGQLAAQQVPGNSGKPLEVYAEEGIEWRREERVYIARGNARAIQDDTEIAAHELRAYYTGSGEGGGDIYKVEAVGNVVITSPGGQAFGDRGTYDVRSQVAVLTGNGLKLVTESDVVTARDSLEYWQAKNLAVARGDAEATRVDEEDGSTNIIRADVMTATFTETGNGEQELTVVDAYDAVEILTPCEYLTGDRGRYLVVEQLAYLSGNVKITRGDNQLNGDEAEVNLATGISTLTGDRVQGLLIPNQGGGAAAPGNCN